MKPTKLHVLGSAAAIAFLATMGTAAAAPIITVQDSGSIPFAVLNLGTGASAGFQSSASLTPSFDDVASIVFAGGSPNASGVYAGSTSKVATSPFPLGSPGSSLTNYLVAQASGGTVTVDFSTPQTSLDLVWGTVDGAPGYNLVTGGGNTITGAEILAAAPGSPTSGTTNTAVEITGLNPFTSLTFTDTTSLSAFEFDLGTSVPEPASLTMFAGALAGLWLVLRRRRKV